MKKDFAPERLDVAAFAREGATLQGREPLRRHTRLLDETRGQGAELPIEWSARGELRSAAGRPDEVWLHLRAHAALPLVCQRCLEPVEVPLDVERRFRFVTDEATALAEDDESDEDVLVQDRAFDLVNLVEDELLMEMPAVPRHEVCPVPVGPAAAAQPQGDPGKPNPFAVLQGLKTGKTARQNR